MRVNLKQLFLRSATGLALFLISPYVFSESDIWPNSLPETAAVPFMYSSESLGTTIGVAGVMKGVGQPQATLFAAGMYSSKGSYLTYLSSDNNQVGHSWLFGANAYNASFKDMDYYIGTAGSNNSHQSDEVFTDSTEAQYHLTANYILPIGNAKDIGAQAAYTPNRKVKSGNPFDSGVSSIELSPFYYSRTLSDVSDWDEPESNWGMKVNFDWDNRNSVRNTTNGSRTELDFTYSPETSSQEEWWTWEFQQSAFFDLGGIGNVIKKQVLAFDFYLADTPSWEEGAHQPPEYAGIKLGGLYRLRSYGGGRFHGRSAVHYSAEYRVMPDWQPLEDWPIFNLYDVPWWQWVAFVDTGRVADEFSLSTLHDDLRWSAGGAIRFQVEGIVVRTEMAWGSEENVFRVMINQPF
jgi:outer membrane protein assembly factor BamA